MIVTGSERAFAAGADIKEMADKSYSQMVALKTCSAPSSTVSPASRNPMIAAVAGHALGGGCELAHGL